MNGRPDAPDSVDAAREAAATDVADAAAPRADADAGDELEEVDVLRGELGRVREALDEARAEAAEAQDRALRARADLENLRRRSRADLERAHGAGLDAAIRPVLTVHDDLERAIEAGRVGDPAAILPGVEAVLAALLRQLEGLGLTKTGEVGEPFDAERHEALTTVPVPEPELAGTIQSVFEAGFLHGDRLVRPARVVVYQEP
ncbi:MAG: nucleotide exchange factor GrpE [Trueperaceae bacterium]|nr:nucleotide exchange factor GrpE [Trueperaceae bacterium]